jgi:hypothetical protein
MVEHVHRRKSQIQMMRNPFKNMILITRICENDRFHPKIE